MAGKGGKLIITMAVVNETNVWFVVLHEGEPVITTDACYLFFDASKIHLLRVLAMNY